MKFYKKKLILFKIKQYICKQPKRSGQDDRNLNIYYENNSIYCETKARDIVCKMGSR